MFSHQQVTLDKSGEPEDQYRSQVEFDAIHNYNSQEVSEQKQTQINVQATIEIEEKLWSCLEGVRLLEQQNQEVIEKAKEEFRSKAINEDDEQAAVKEPLESLLLVEDMLAEHTVKY